MTLTLLVVFGGLTVLLLIVASFLAAFKGVIIDPLSDFKNKDD